MELAVDYSYRYAGPSAVIRNGTGTRIRLAGSESREGRSPFFAGVLKAPRRTADLMLGLAEVARSRFYTPPAMLERILIQTDPVITCGAGRLRFEAFSSCCGVYARLDLLEAAFEAERVEGGTTNVDFNAGMRAALARLGERDTARLSVSGEAVELETGKGSVVERKVKLPVRWLKGLVEAQACQARMSRRFGLTPVAAQRFVREAARTATRGPVWISPAASGVRLSQRASNGAVRVGGIERLRLIESVIRHARSMEVYATEDGATGWEVDTAEARYFVVLSPEPWRGFSGEGRVLEVLSRDKGARVLGRVRAELRWQAVLDADGIAREFGVKREPVACALAQLGTMGLVGFDMAEQKYFHRELPFDLGLVEQFHPRLKDARELVADERVRIALHDRAVTQAWVKGGGAEYRVRRRGPEWSCICPWYGKHGVERGPCKHILAVQLTVGGDEESS